jgi:hypothetical protein
MPRTILVVKTTSSDYVPFTYVPFTFIIKAFNWRTNLITNGSCEANLKEARFSIIIIIKIQAFQVGALASGIG